MNKRDMCRFRAWLEVYDAEKSTEDKEVTKKKMFYSVESANDTDLCDRYIGSPIPFDEIFNIPNAVIMQCSGLKDSTGKRIYEGDVVEIRVGILVLFGLIVYFGGTDTHVGFKMAELDDDVWEDFILEDYDTVTVVGNIFETEIYQYLQKDFLENYYGGNNE